MIHCWVRKPSLHLVQEAARFLGVQAMQKADLPAHLITSDLAPDTSLIPDELATGTREGAGIPIQDLSHPTSSWLFPRHATEDTGLCCL